MRAVFPEMFIREHGACRCVLRKKRLLYPVLSTSKYFGFEIYQVSEGITVPRCMPAQFAYWPFRDVCVMRSLLPWRQRRSMWTFYWPSLRTRRHQLPKSWPVWLRACGCMPFLARCVAVCLLSPALAASIAPHHICMIPLPLVAAGSRGHMHPSLERHGALCTRQTCHVHDLNACVDICVILASLREHQTLKKGINRLGAPPHGIFGALNELMHTNGRNATRNASFSWLSVVGLCLSVSDTFLPSFIGFYGRGMMAFGVAALSLSKGCGLYDTAALYLHMLRFGVL